MSPHVARLLETISAGRITVVNDAGPVQLLQVRGRQGGDGAPSITDGVPRVTEFGFASSPPIGSEVVLVRLWGDRTLSLAIGTNHQPSRLKGLQAGDSALYDVRGAKVLLGPAGPVIDGAGQALTVQDYGPVATFDQGLTTMGPLAAGNGWTGTFKTGDGRMATVAAGIITQVV